MVNTNTSTLLLFVLVLVQGEGYSQEGLIAKDAKLELLADGFEFTEGPAVDSSGNIFFTDQPNNRILKWSAAEKELSIFMEDAGRSNGLYFDQEGKLIACADENFQLWEIDSNKNIRILLDAYEGKRLNGPNDLWIDDKGGIYFTDPYYQRPYWERESKEIEEERVYYLPPGMEPIIVADDFIKPNGIIGTPDGKTLYIADIGANKTFSYKIEQDGSLSNKKLFTELGSDGMTIDNQGNVYLTGEGVSVFNSQGEKIQHIPVDQGWTANVTFGGPDEQYLFITAMNSLYSLKMNTNGIRWVRGD